MATAEQTQLAYLEAMGVQAWRLRMAPPFAGSANLVGEPQSSIPPGTDQSDSVLKTESDLPAISDSLVTQSITPEPDAESPRPLTEPNYFSVSPIPGDTAVPSAQDSPALIEIPQKACNWEELQAQVQSCQRCALHQTRTQTVFGVGNPKADWLVIGEAPGEQEDLQGEPFVGRAGLLLNEMLRAIGFPRETVYIANILKCRPPKNRDPQPDEAAACEGYLKRQIALIQPKIILAVGRIAAQNLLKTTTPIGKLRGMVHDYQGVPLVVTYHPAYLLRSPLEKRNAFDDLRLALRTYRQTL